MSLSRYEIANYGIDKGKEKEGKTRVEKLIMIITIIKRQKRNKKHD